MFPLLSASLYYNYQWIADYLRKIFFDGLSHWPMRVSSKGKGGWIRFTEGNEEAGARFWDFSGWGRESYHSW